MPLNPYLVPSKISPKQINQYWISSVFLSELFLKFTQSQRMKCHLVAQRWLRLNTKFYTLNWYNHTLPPNQYTLTVKPSHKKQQHSINLQQTTFPISLYPQQRHWVTLKDQNVFQTDYKIKSNVLCLYTWWECYLFWSLRIGLGSEWPFVFFLVCPFTPFLKEFPPWPIADRFRPPPDGPLV